MESAIGRSAIPVSMPETALHRAALKGDEAKVKRLLREHPEMARQEDSLGNTPFLNAACSGHIGSARLLLEACPESADVQAMREAASDQLRNDYDDDSVFSPVRFPRPWATGQWGRGS